MTTLLKLNEIPHILSDGYLCDARRGVLFLSLWGRDTAIQELLARLTLKNEEGLSQLTLVSDALHEHLLFPGDCLDKRSSRHPRTRFGELINLWLFDKRCLEPDRANGLAFLLLKRDDPHWRERVWVLLQETTSLPLLPHWQGVILEMLQTGDMLTPLGGYGDVSGWQLALDTPRFTEQIREAIVDGILTVDAGQGGAVVSSRYAA